VNQRSCPQIMDLCGLLKGGHTILGKGSMAIVLLYMGSAELVKIKVLAVTTVVQALEGRNNIRDHGTQRNDCGGHARLDAHPIGQQTS
jgi:hypothetical protein